jgi:hypothetical protein
MADQRSGIAVSVAVAVGLLLGGAWTCGGEQPTSSPAAASAPRVSAEQRDYEAEGELDMSTERRSRWRWRGARQRCHFTVDNTCFRSRRAACKAAGCSGKACRATGQAPAAVRCASAKSTGDRRDD